MRKIEDIKADIAEWEERPMDDMRAFRLKELRREYIDTMRSGIPLYRLEAICAAERDGRCVILQAKPNDEVWLLLERLDGKPPEVVQSKVVSVWFNRVGGITYSCFIDSPLIDNTLEFTDDDFGKTVFITREAAEAAQKEGK